MDQDDKNARTIAWAVLGVVILAAVIALLTGCASTGPSSSATDWRSIHQRSPDTGS